jgi:hypothetical protein
MKPIITRFKPENKLRLLIEVGEEAAGRDPNDQGFQTHIITRKQHVSRKQVACDQQKAISLRKKAKNKGISIRI